MIWLFVRVLFVCLTCCGGVYWRCSQGAYEGTGQVVRVPVMVPVRVLFWVLVGVLFA